MRNYNWWTDPANADALSNRRRWFLDRIGKRVFRTSLDCDCNVCQIIYKQGLIIEDRDQAIFMYDTECDVNADGDIMRYFDTKEEVTEFENQNK